MKSFEATTGYESDKHFKLYCIVETGNPYPVITWIFEGNNTFFYTSKIFKQLTSFFNKHCNIFAQAQMLLSKS